MKKKVLVIMGHPREGSYVDALAHAYVKGARKGGANVRYVELRNLKFDFLSLEDRRQKGMEPDLKKMQDNISWCEHLVVIYPTWWGGPTALMKGFFERVITPGFGFKYKKSGWGWHRLLKGRSARIITATGGPWILNHLVYHASHIKSMKWATLWFAGFGPIKVTEINSVDTKWMTNERLKNNIKDVQRIGECDAY